MQFLDLIPRRWLDYEPASLCHFGLETALAIAGTVGSVVGTGMQMKAGMDQAEYQAAVARNEAVVLKQKANEDAAAGQRVAITRERQTDFVQSRARALAAASGTDATSPDIVDNEADIAQQGQYNALSALYEGQSRARSSNYQAEIDLFKANRIEDAAPWAAAGTLFSGVGTLASRMRRDDPMRDYLLGRPSR